MMPSRRDVLKAGGVVAAGLAAGGVARAGAWSPALYEPPVGTWLQPRYGFGNTGHNPDASPPADSPDLAWTYEVDEPVNGLAAGVGKLYVGSEHVVSAFEYGDQHPQWDEPAGGYVLAGSHDVVVTAGSGSVAVLDAGSGATRWRQDESKNAFGLLADERTAYVGWEDRLDAFALNSGRRRWSVKTGGRTFPGFDDGQLVVGGTHLGRYDARGTLSGVLSDAPTRAWTCEDVRGPTRPVSAGEYTLAGTSPCSPRTTCSVSAVTPDGSHEYRVELGNDAGNVATDGERAYVVSMLYGERENGYDVSDSTTLHALDVATGDELWTFQRPGWFCAPVVADGTVYVGEYGTGNGNGNLHALDAASGDRRWTYRHLDGVNVLVAVGDSLFVGADDGRVLELQ